MPVSDEYLTYVLEQLKGGGPVQARRMFGGAGLYCGHAGCWMDGSLTGAGKKKAPDG